MLVDITPYTFGTEAVGELHGSPYMHQFVPLIRRNTRLPVSRSDLFRTLHEEQEVVRVQVYQGEDPDALKNAKIGDFLFEGLNEDPDASDQGILLTYSLNLDGILEVHALERSSGREIRGVVEDAVGRSTPEQVATAKDRLEALWRGTEPEGRASGQPAPTLASPNGAEELPEDVPAGIRDVLVRADKALSGAADEDREEMAILMQSIRGAAAGGRMDEAQALAEDLGEILFFVE